jgi:hypothetical protein
MRTGSRVAVAARVVLLGLLARVLTAGPDDHRFRDKGIRERALLLVPAACLAGPVAWSLRRTMDRAPGPYPGWADSLGLSIVALDLAGNVFDLYDRYLHFDLLPHGHGAGALTVLLAWTCDLPVRRAAVLATAGHVVLEAQEAASDAIWGFRNVRGWWDTAGDLGIGLVGTVTYGAAFAAWRACRGQDGGRGRSALRP